VLTVTESASQAVHDLVSQPGLPDEAGLRIAISKMTQNGGGPSSELELTVVPAPQPDDREVPEEPIYLESGVDRYLEDMILDAERLGDEVRFSLQPQIEGGEGLAT
jgi:Fe-S cluster assembly iron-binding protein IscA